MSECFDAVLESPIIPLNRVQLLIQAVDHSASSLSAQWHYFSGMNREKRAGPSISLSNELSGPNICPGELLPDQTQGRRVASFTNSWVQTIPRWDQHSKSYCFFQGSSPHPIHGPLYPAQHTLLS